MTVIANDFVPIVPYETQGMRRFLSSLILFAYLEIVVTLGIGQRTDVLVTGLPGAEGAYIMRASLASFPCAVTSNPDATAIIYYKHDALLAGTPNTTAWPAFTESLGKCHNVCLVPLTPFSPTNKLQDDLTKTVPFFPIAADLNPPTTEVLDIQFGPNGTGHWVWTMGGSSFRANYNQPILLLSNLGNNSYPDSPQWNVHNFGSNSSVRIHITNPGFLAHPIHLHGHNMFVISEGLGTWDGSIANGANPQRRDVQIVQAGGYLVLQFESDNPGAWPLHCHIAWHVSAGLYVTVVERPDDIAKLKIPAIMAQTCRDWAAFTNRTVVDQIDSGL